MVGSDATPAMLEAARRVAEAEVDLIRIRQARAAVLKGPISDQYRYPMAETRVRLTVIQNEYLRTRNPTLPEAMLDLVDPIPPSEISDTKRLEIRLGEVAAALKRLDRYQTRATSRRTRAVRAFEEVAFEKTTPPRSDETRSTE
jgi:hypothetical protein